MKLHLGCGGNYLHGYINIDFPKDKHGHRKVDADRYANILELKYPANSIEEIRLHHVYEHFSRAQAWALLGSWNSWLIESGRLRLEMPDFDENATSILNKKTSYKKKTLLLRHLFGSQEANWAIHYHGWTPWELKRLLQLAGFQIISLKKIINKGMVNIEIIAEKKKPVNRKNFTKVISHYADNFLVDYSTSEQTTKVIWMQEFNKVLNLTWSNNIKE